MGTPGDRQNLFVLTGVTCMHLYRLGELTLYSLTDISLYPCSYNESLLYLFVYLSICLFMYLFVYLFVCLFVCLFIYLFICLFVYVFREELYQKDLHLLK